MFISDSDVKLMHDLIVRIQRNTYQLNDDADNLYNLIHFVKGDGIRNEKYKNVTVN